MNTFLHKKFEYNLNNRLNLNNGSNILLAISGGQDSLCLLNLFIKIKTQYQLNLAIINIDHQWRDDSVDNTNHLINLIKYFNIPAYIYQIHPVSYSELESRNLRYQLLLHTAIKYKYSLIATAHTSDDQIETCIYNLTRGSSLDGLNSLVWTRQINKKVKIIRPLLNFQRWEITWLCRNLYLPMWSDTSNLNYLKTRNRIRHELIPYIKYHLQNKIEQNLTHFITYTSIDSEYIRQNTVKIYQSIKHSSLIAINCQILICQHLSLQRRVIHLFFLHNANISLPHEILHKILNSIHCNTKIDFFYSRIRIQHNYKWLYFS